MTAERSGTAHATTVTQRHVEPHRLVSIGRRWYLVAHDRTRHDWRSFRVDRVVDAELTGNRFRQRELPAEDALAFVRAGIASMPMKYVVRVRFEAPVEVVSGFVRHWATVEADGAGCVMEMRTEALDWPLMVLANVDADFTVEEPAELREALARVAGRFARAAAG